VPLTCQLPAGPQVAEHQRWNKQQTLEHLVHKAGYAGAPEDVFGAGAGPYKLTRYQSTTCTLSYAEYLRLKAEQQQRGQAGAEADGGAVRAKGAGTGAAGSPRHQAGQGQQQPFRLGGGGKAGRGQLVTVPA
jgi:hypothetical protein